jgi:hypothetical protein
LYRIDALRANIGSLKANGCGLATSSSNVSCGISKK